jgi:Tol biopolymer transport system component
MTKLTGQRFHDTEAPALSPDGSRILFVAFGAGGEICGIWRMKPDGADKALFSPPASRMYFWGFEPDGSSVLVGDNCAGPLPQSIDRMNADGGGFMPLTDPGCCSQDIAASYSPDGERIVFMSNRLHPGFSDGLPREIYVMNADGSGLVQISTSGLFSGLDWGPETS